MGCACPMTFPEDATDGVFTFGAEAENTSWRKLTRILLK